MFRKPQWGALTRYLFFSLKPPVRCSERDLMVSITLTRTLPNPWQALLVGGPPGSLLTPDVPLGGLQMEEMTYSVSRGATPASLREREPEGWRKEEGENFPENMFTMAASEPGWAANDTAHEQKKHSRPCVRTYTYSLNTQLTELSYSGHWVKTRRIRLLNGVQGHLTVRETSLIIKTILFSSHHLTLMALNLNTSKTSRL